MAFVAFSNLDFEVVPTTGKTPEGCCKIQANNN